MIISKKNTIISFIYLFIISVSYSFSADIAIPNFQYTSNTKTIGRSSIFDKFLDYHEKLHIYYPKQIDSELRSYANQIKANTIENTIVENFSRLENIHRYKNLSQFTKYSGNKGIDGLYVKYNKLTNEVEGVKILEAKSGKNGLSSSSGLTEMSQPWSLDRVRLIKSLDKAEIPNYQQIVQKIEKGDYERIIARGNIVNGNLDISLSKIPNEFQSSESLKYFNEEAHIYRKHSISLSDQNLTHGKRKVRDDFFRFQRAELKDSKYFKSEKTIKKIEKEIIHNNKIRSDIKLSNKNSYENTLLKKSRSPAQKVKKSFAKTKPKTMRRIVKAAKFIPYVAYAIEIGTDVWDFWKLYKRYGNGEINSQVLIIKSVGLAGGLASGWLGAKAGGVIGNRIGMGIGAGIGFIVSPFVGPEAVPIGMNIGAGVGELAGNVVGFIIGYNKGKSLFEAMAYKVSTRFYKTLDSPEYFAKLCNNVRVYYDKNPPY